MTASPAKPARFVTAVCPCGASFDREVKRGRPQIWCPACVEIPFYERNRSQEPVVVTASGEVPARKVSGSEFDRLAHVRAEVEAEIAEINADHKVRFAALLATGVSAFEVATIVQAESADKMRAVYAKYGKVSGEVVAEPVLEEAA